jgi:hypothetical protein
VADYGKVVARGTAARVAAPHLRSVAGVGEGERGGVPAGELLAALVPAARRRTRADERPYLDRVAARLAGGNLSERIRRHVARVPARRREPAIRALYEELARCLVENRVWEG